MEETVNLSALFVKREDDNGKREEGNVKREDDTAQANSDPCPLLWSGTILLHRERATSLTVAVKIFHQDDSKNTNENCFDWPAGGLPSVAIKRYPMAVLGGKSKPSMKSLKPFIKDSHIVRLVCDDPKQQEELTKELERDEDGQQCFLADPGEAKIEITTFFRQALPFLWSLLRWTKIYSDPVSVSNPKRSSSLHMKSSGLTSPAILSSIHGPRTWQQMWRKQQSMFQWKHWILASSISVLRIHGVKAEKFSKVKQYLVLQLNPSFRPSLLRMTSFAQILRTLRAL